MECQYCKGRCIKAGVHKKGVQKYYCKSCEKYQQKNYKYIACIKEKDDLLKKCIDEGNSIRGASRITDISISTIIRKIKRRSKKIESEKIYVSGDEYEVDELRTYIWNKKRICWVMYAISRTTGRVIDMLVGRRTKRNLGLLIEKLLKLNARTIYTDRLKEYLFIIPSNIHKRGKRRTNKIERMNLNLRTHIKRLNRRTICYSESKLMLESCLKIYFWG